MFTAPRAEPRVILAAALQDLGVVIHPQTNILSVEMANNMNYFCSLRDRIEKINSSKTAASYISCRVSER